MPIIKLNELNKQQQELKNLLLQELRSEGPKGAKNAPLIYLDEEELVGIGKSVRIFVVWSKWKDIPAQSRSKVIVHAVREWKEEQIPYLRVALGLLPSEASEYGLDPGD